MKKSFVSLALVALLCGQSAALAWQSSPPAERPQASQAQSAKPQARPAPATAAQQPQPPPRRPVERRPSSPDLADYGIQIAPDPRLIVLMAALEAAGFDPTPKGAEASAFRGVVRQDLSELDPALRARLKDFYERYKLTDEGATAADQTARYVSLAYTLGPPPEFEAPPRSDDLPAGVLDVLDFVPLVREFLLKSSAGGRLPDYLQMHRAEGDKLRGPAVEMARAVLTYFNTRPETIFYERAESAAPAAQGNRKKPKQEQKAPPLRERMRRFVIVPDLLAAPGAINFRVVRDDYFVVVPAGTDPRSSELRRGYLQYVVDPLVARFSREVAAKRPEIKSLLDAEAARKGRALTPDVFLATARSLVAAADARMDETARLRALQLETSAQLQSARDAAARDAALKESKQRQSAIADESVARLAEAYERGAVLSFHFAEQLRGLEGSGFDIASRTHVASGRILAFLERTADAMREFDAAIALADIPNGAYREALAEKKKLSEKK
ncbi:MAG: hypothetical protein LC802_02410 [Acidobacteria bacterium]|nr:hypothetical protein [Acidobacteriota bacterium]